MGTIYKRGSILYIGWLDENGKQICKSSGYRKGQEALAQALIDEMERRVEEKLAKPVKVATVAPSTDSPRKKKTGPESLLGMTVEQYAKKWLKGREGRIASVEDERGRIYNHILPRIGQMPIRDVRPKHIRDLIFDLRNAKMRKRGTGVGEVATVIAPRTVLHSYSTLSRMFKSAVIDEVIDTNPVIVEKGVLPKNVDKDPTWRATAVFAREELISLISDERIPEHRRVLNALKGLAALRHGEAAGLKFSDYHPEEEPLGKLVIARSYEKSTKTQVTREVPVHPTLAIILKRWREHGFAGAFGRVPTANDQVVPSRNGVGIWEAHDADDYFKEDLATLGLRNRRGHDLRRTFITLAQVDGGRREVLKTITHGAPVGDIVSLYTSFPWPTVCGEVAKFQVELQPSAARSLDDQRRAVHDDRPTDDAPTLSKRDGRGIRNRDVFTARTGDDLAVTTRDVPDLDRVVADDQVVVDLGHAPHTALAAGLHPLVGLAHDQQDPRFGGSTLLPDQSGNGESIPATSCSTSATTVPTAAIPNSPEISSRWAGMIRRPTVYETVALPLSYTG